jgi:hypothetical protein
MERLASKKLRALRGGEFAAAFFNEVEDLPRDQFREMIAALLADSALQKTDAAKLLAGLWAERDLPAALGWVQGLKAWKYEMGGAIFETWAQANFSEMALWIDALPGEIDSDLGRAARFTLCKSGPEVSPDEVFRLLKKLSADQDYGGTYYIYWSSHDPASAAARALLEPDEARRTAAIGTVVGSWAGRDPEATHAWVEALQDPVLASDQRARIGGVIGWSSPEKGARYLASIPQDDPARRALGSVLSSWKKRGLAAPLIWASGLEKESIADWAFGEIVRDAAPEKIEAAIAELPSEARAVVAERWAANRDKNEGRINPPPAP